MGVDLTNIQGLVFSGYQKWEFARFRLLTVTDATAAKRWLATEVDALTYGTEDKAAAKQARVCRNLAFTAEGLKVLGLCEDHCLGFDPAFVEGMAAPGRAALLGDLAGSRSDPKHWRWGVAAQAPVHILQLVYGQTDDDARLACIAATEATRGFLSEVDDPHRLALYNRSAEHFGFADGVSQPRYDQLSRPGGAGYESRRLALGELLLGHPDGLGNITPGPVIGRGAPGADMLSPTPDGDGDFGRDGAYLVCRQLRQDVPAFFRMLASLAQAPAVTSLLPDSTPQERQDWVASRIVGRWPSGCPVVQSPDRDDRQLENANSFLFETVDGRGHACPYGSHIRRANPRDSVFEPWASPSLKDARSALAASDRRRILRRGRAFGPPWSGGDDTAERGLMFIALCGAIERQFEFVQRSWLLNPDFAGLPGETDPLVGTSDNQFTIQAAPFARRLQGVDAHVWAEGGAYFLLPSRRAMRFLATV